LRLSVVIPSFNHATFLEACLESVVGQAADGVGVEAIVIDGGSTDGSREIIERYADQLAYWVSEPDRGQSHALSKGFERSTGEVMGWLNSDDMLAPGALAVVAEFFRERPDIDLLYGDMKLVDREGRPLKVKKETAFDLGAFLWVYNYIPQPSTFWRRRTWERSGGLDEGLQCAMDCDLWLKFVKAGAKFAHVPVVLSCMRMYPEQKNQRLREISNREDLILRERFLGRKTGRFESARKKLWHKARRVMKRLAVGAYWARPGR